MFDSIKKIESDERNQIYTKVTSEGIRRAGLRVADRVNNHAVLHCANITASKWHALMISVDDFKIHSPVKNNDHKRY